MVHPPAPGILVAAPRNHLRQSTDEALSRYAPAVLRESICGRDIPVSLRRASEQLGFEARHSLEQISEDLLVDLDEVDR